MFKKSIIILSFLAALLLPLFVFSVTDNNFGLDLTAKKTGFDTQSEQGDINLMANRVIRVGFGAVAFIFFGLMLYAGLRWLTARGKEELIERAKATVEGAIIGLILVAMSYAIATFVVDRLSSPAGEQVVTPEGPIGCCLQSVGGQCFISTEAECTPSVRWYQTELGTTDPEFCNIYPECNN